MKRLSVLVAVFILFVVLASPVFAKNPKSPADFHGLDHPGMASQLYLYEKDSDWNVVEDGAWGKLNFTADRFSFSGHGLVPGTSYTLIRYKDPWPGSPVCLGTATSNGGGNIHISGDWEEGGPKVWLVLSNDVNCDTPAMTGWHPSEYLFEYNTI